nr:hypothetical protein [Burkholderia ambifaria]
MTPAGTAVDAVDAADAAAAALPAAATVSATVATAPVAGDVSIGRTPSSAAHCAVLASMERSVS